MVQWDLLVRTPGADNICRDSGALGGYGRAFGSVEWLGRADAGHLRWFENMPATFREVRWIWFCVIRLILRWDPHSNLNLSEHLLARHELRLALDKSAEVLRTFSSLMVRFGHGSSSDRLLDIPEYAQTLWWHPSARNFVYPKKREKEYALNQKLSRMDRPVALRSCHHSSF